MSNDSQSPRRRSRRPFQFGLSTLLLVMLVAAVLVAWQREPLARWVESLFPALAAEPADSFPRVVLHTSMGDITVRLNVEKAPLTVENFLHYVDEGFYTDTIFHDVRRDDVIIAGGYTADMKEKPTTRQPVRNEALNGLNNIRGTISMVREPNVIDSSTSQFFFNISDRPNDYLDPQPLQPGEQPGQIPEKYGYCVFGEVVAGMDVLDAIAKLEISDQGGTFVLLPKQQVVIKSAERVGGK